MHPTLCYIPHTMPCTPHYAIYPIPCPIPHTMLYISYHALYPILHPVLCTISCTPYHALLHDSCTPYSEPQTMPYPMIHLGPHNEGRGKATIGQEGEVEIENVGEVARVSPSAMQTSLAGTRAVTLTLASSRAAKVSASLPSMSLHRDFSISKSAPAQTASTFLTHKVMLSLDYPRSRAIKAPTKCTEQMSTWVRKF